MATDAAALFGRLGVTKVVVQSSWDEEEDQELLDFLRRSDAALQIADGAEIAALEPSESTMVFADSRLVQGLVGGAGVIPTYPECLAPLLNRSMARGRLADLGEAALATPFFAKPAGGHKAFAARLVRDACELAALAAEAGSEAEVYACEAVDFVSEHRLFIGPDRLWGLEEYSEYMVSHRILNQHPARTGPLTVADAEVPAELVERVRRLAAGLGFVVVDVGLTADGRWCLVEANPPFALSSYGLDIATYTEYCTEAWLHLLRNRGSSQPTE